VNGCIVRSFTDQKQGNGFGPILRPIVLVISPRQQNPQLRVFCVGDDWQAINGFAGSDLRFYHEFERFFQPSCTLHVVTNYRSATTIVDISNALMRGLGAPSRAYKTMSGVVAVADLETFQPTPTEAEAHPGDSLTPAVVRLVGKAVTDGKAVVLLSRKHSLPWYVHYNERRGRARERDLRDFLGLVHSHLPKEWRHMVTISTAHTYKGLQQHVVIVLDAVTRCYPLLHPNFLFTRIFGDSITRVVAEERRLFYVALTRAVEHLFILTEKSHLSPFLDELQQRTQISRISWLDYPPLAGSIKHMTVMVGNQDGRSSKGTFAIKDLLKAEGYRWSGNAWCCTWPAQGFSAQAFSTRAMWSTSADGIEVRFEDDAAHTVALYRVDRGRWRRVFDHISGRD
jgi:DNA helicase-4